MLCGVASLEAHGVLDAAALAAAIDPHERRLDGHGFVEPKWRLADLDG